MPKETDTLACNNLLYQIPNLGTIWNKKQQVFFSHWYFTFKKEQIREWNILDNWQQTMQWLRIWGHGYAISWLAYKKSSNCPNAFEMIDSIQTNFLLQMTYLWFNLIIKLIIFSAYTYISLIHNIIYPKAWNHFTFSEVI